MRNEKTRDFKSDSQDDLTTKKDNIFKILRYT